MTRRGAGPVRAARVALTALTLWLVLGACGDDAPTSPTAGGPRPTAPATGVVHRVQALDNSFRPETIEVKVGDEVVFENVGRNEHNVLPTGGDAWGVETDDFGPGDAYSNVFTAPGEYPYYCSLHGTTTAGMIGKVVVAP